MLEEVNLPSLTKLSASITFHKDNYFRATKWFLCFSPELLHALRRVKSIGIDLRDFTRMKTGIWSLLRIPKSVFNWQRKCSKRYGWLHLCDVWDMEGWVTRVEELLGFFFPLIPPMWWQAGTYKFIASNQLWICRCHVDSLLTCSSDHKAGMLCAGCCRYKATAIHEFWAGFLPSPLVHLQNFRPLSWSGFPSSWDLRHLIPTDLE